MERTALDNELLEARRVADLAREAAERASQAKSRFLAMASHDLRQPLQTLSLLHGSLRRLVTDIDAADLLRQQEQAIGAMSRLLHALLDISKIESGAIKPDPTDFAVATLFDELRGEFMSLAVSKGLRLQVETSTVCVHSDPSLVGQILRNLISNAIKYTREGWVQLRCLRDAARVQIDVLDTGIGIPADQLPYIYDEFYQVGSSDRLRDGYGLGLSIVQRLVKLLNLELDVHSEAGHGTAFSLRLPAGGPAAAFLPARSARPGIDGTGAGRAHVLLVEDEPAVRAATRMLLSVEGYRVTPAASLGESLEAAHGAPAIDLIIADYHLGNGVTGPQVIAAIRTALARPLPAVLMTGDTSLAIKQLANEAQLRTVSKPVNADELLELLAELLAAGPRSGAGFESH